MSRSPLRVLPVAAGWVTALLLLAAPAGVAAGQGDDVRRRIEALEAGQKDILRQLQELKGAVQQGRPPAQPGPQAAPPVPAEPLTIDGSASRGNAKARLTIVEFSDFQCPFCGRFAREAFELLDREYIATGKVRYVFRNFPIEKIHPSAFKAALAGECARQTGRFWELHHRLFANQQLLGDVDLLNHARAAGVDGAAFQRCVVSPPATARVRQDLADGARAGITGTPTFFLGIVQADGKLKVLRKLPGAVPYGTIKSTVEALLASPEVPR